MHSKILVVDDERPIRESLQMILNEEGYQAEVAANGKEALDILEESNFSLVITDLKMPEMGGMELLSQARKKWPETMFIIITAYASIETAIIALRKGAYDYLIKPLDFDDLLMRVKRMMEHRELVLENQYLRGQLEEKYGFSNIIGESEKMKSIFQMITRVAPTKSNVLITGPSGSGKELVAKAIHYNSARKNKRFVPINCGAIVDTLMESEFFGYKKGAFTGAIKDQDGHFLTADGGTLFLDEIGEIPLHLQVKLLRVLEEGEITPVGDSTPIPVDVRLIAATNRDLRADVESGKFREDLYYRLNVVEIQLPPLSERKEDIPLLVNHFIRKYNREMGTQIHGVDNKTMRILMNYPWKGGIRELQNAIERAMIFASGKLIIAENLPPSLLQHSSEN
jgi:two-component system response regulator PilR (NtrC family)